jgi:hypothetical protein
MSLLSHFAPRLCTPGRCLFFGELLADFLPLPAGIWTEPGKMCVFSPGFVSQQQLYLPTPLL